MNNVIDNGDGTVTLSKEEYEQLVDDSFWLMCLEEAGVDNWEGTDQAMKLLKEYEKGNEH